MTSFLGVDLAFSVKNWTGICALNSQGELVGTEYVNTDDAIARVIAQYADPTGTVIVIDAPLVCANETGQRECERHVGQVYGHRHASCHSSNTKNCAGQRGPQLLMRLKERYSAIVLKTDAREVTDSLWPVIETYPHPAHLELFHIDRIIDYKKGRIFDRQRGLARYLGLLRELAKYVPTLKVESVPFLKQEVTERGAPLKRREDLLDALFCAYVGLYLWHYRQKPHRWRVFGDVNAGFITIPVGDHLKEK